MTGRTQTPHEVLGVPLDASAADIKRAWRRLVKETHPDHGGDAARFQAVQTAYEELTDPDARRRREAEEDRSSSQPGQTRGPDPDAEPVFVYAPDMDIFEDHGEAATGPGDRAPWWYFALVASASAGGVFGALLLRVAGFPQDWLGAHTGGLPFTFWDPADLGRGLVIVAVILSALLVIPARAHWAGGRARQVFGPLLTPVPVGAVFLFWDVALWLVVVLVALWFALATALNVLSSD